MKNVYQTQSASIEIDVAGTGGFHSRFFQETAHTSSMLVQQAKAKYEKLQRQGVEVRPGVDLQHLYSGDDPLIGWAHKASNSASSSATYEFLLFNMPPGSTKAFSQILESLKENLQKECLIETRIYDFEEAGKAIQEKVEAQLQYEGLAESAKQIAAFLGDPKEIELMLQSLAAGDEDDDVEEEALDGQQPYQ